MVDNLHLSALRTQSLPFRIEEFGKSRILDIANQTIVRAIKEQATHQGLPQRYVESIHSDFDGEYLWIWIDFKGKNNEPLDEFFEEGTQDHYIKPRFKKALAFTGEGRHASAINYAAGEKSTGKKFSKGHYVSGIDAKHTFRTGSQKGYNEFKTKLAASIQNYLEETRLFG